MLAQNITLISVFLPHIWRCWNFLIEISSHSDKLISIAFFQWLEDNPTGMLHLKEVPHGTHHNNGEENEEEEKKPTEKPLHNGLDLNP